MKDLFDRIKTSLRISHNLLDDEIKDDINTALLDMRRVGIEPYLLEDEEIAIDEDGYEILKDDLIRKDIELYVKADMDYMDKSDKFEKAYNHLRDALALSGDYREGKDEE